MAAGSAPTVARPKARLWDAPTRIVHWALVALIGFSWWSAEAGRMEWHRWAGYAVLGLIVFRLIWGVVGSASARFSGFVPSLADTIAYAKTLPIRTRSEHAGHNPLGAWSVVAMLAAISGQVITGLFSVDIDGLESGPLSDRVSFEIGRQFAEWHQWIFSVIQILVLLHLAAVAFYLLYKRTNLIAPMLTGRRAFASDPALSFAPLWRAILVAVFAAAITWWVMGGLRL
ncbi:MAG: cytochrome b/b6 domain-containing protein [Phenylobacterium sp.]|uniref:cytochrome b/b6 domain-containing protein n=1 Tax=Phenylobacterium sp. TaxID=1871053 RepID=UPI00273484D0|nr:cytochrome b/b6 domain-containing protein [Phenylobacterium sp.]MDP3173550.1 cytochrome b/b6 domain-containing protein [Phenylobacterium sp.]